MFHLPPPPNFQGLRKDVPITEYRRNLPHWRQSGATYFVTFRLADSLPASHVDLLNDLRDNWARQNPRPHTPEKSAELFRLLEGTQERWLDEGHGSCVLRRADNLIVLRNALQFFDIDASHQDQRYELDAFVLMPNHVHLVVRPFDERGHSLESVLRSWKGFTAREINKRTGTSGNLWFEESFDRIVRDEQHLDRCLQYIGRNPAKAGLAEESCARWMRASWCDLGWDFRD